VSFDGLTVSYVGNTDGTWGIAWLSESASNGVLDFTVKLARYANYPDNVFDISVGVIPESAISCYNGTNIELVGHADCGGCGYIGQMGRSDCSNYFKDYGALYNVEGYLIRTVLNFSDGTLGFYVNDVYQGVAATGLRGAYYGAVSMVSRFDVFELVSLNRNSSDDSLILFSTESAAAFTTTLANSETNALKIILIIVGVSICVFIIIGVFIYRFRKRRNLLLKNLQTTGMEVLTPISQTDGMEVPITISQIDGIQVLTKQSYVQVPNPEGEGENFVNSQPNETQFQPTNIPQNNNTCIICHYKQKNHAIIPCGHLIVCEDHNNPSQFNNVCPICRTPIQSFF